MIITLQDVTRRFDHVGALKNVTLAVKQGELLAVTGPDGAGKSTLLRVLAGVLSPSKGTVKRRAAPVRVGYLPRPPGLYPRLTAWENIAFFARIYGLHSQAVRRRGRALLEWAGLWEERDRPAGELTGGLRQKLSLACALVHEADLLLLDEPTGDDDPGERQEFWHLIDDLVKSGTTVVVATPHMEEAAHCHRVALLHQGRLLACGSPEALLAKFPAPTTPTGRGSEPMTADAAPAIAVRDLSRSFAGVRAVKGVTLTVPAGAIFGLVGPTGAGKSTLIRMLLGLLPPELGEGRVAGCDITCETLQVRERCGYVSQQLGLYAGLTAEENLSFFGSIYGLSPTALHARRKELLRWAGLLEHRTEPAGRLGPALRRRLALACALMHRPALLLLDEPVSGLDPNDRSQYWELLHDLSAGGTTVLVATSHMPDAEGCDLMGFLLNGRLTATAQS
jgi:ABC-type multidrug transport system ATPase subunit